VVAALGGNGVPAQGLGIVLRGAATVFITPAEPVLRCDVALVGGSLKLREGLGGVFGQAAAV
jgi:hypothetical protein